MKVAILTYHNTPNNSGAVLQAYALQRTIEKIGHEAVIIDYYRERGDMKPWWSFRSISGIYHTMRMIFLESLRLRKCRAFRRQHLNLTAAEYGGRVQYCGADAYITGSDQVFNPVHNEGNPDFLLDFVPSGKRRIAYGASFGTNDFTAEYKEMLRVCLPRFNALSVREETSVALIKEIAGLDASVVLDPTLLLDADEYKPLMASATIASLPAEKYVFVYLIGQHPDAMRIAVQKAKEIGSKRIVLMTNGRAEWHWSNEGMVRQIGVFSPADFLLHIANAAHIVTNSFHGTVFSLILNRMFTSLKNGNVGDDRMATLLNARDGGVLDMMREESISFLREALS